MDELRAKYPDALTYDQLPEFMNRNTGADIKAMGPNVLFKKKVDQVK